MHKNFGFLCVVLLLMAGCATSPSSCTITKAAQAELDFIGGNIPVLDARINDIPARLIVDTGDSNSAITLQMVDRAQLHTIDLPMVRAMGIGGETKVMGAEVEHFSIGHAVGHRFDFFVSNLFGNDYNKRVGVDGLLGEETLANYDIDFNFPAHRISFYRVSGCIIVEPPWHGPTSILPLTYNEHHLPTIPVSLDDHVIQATLDTGAATTVISRAALDDLGIEPGREIPGKTVTLAGVGAFRPIGHFYHFTRIEIGFDRFDDPAILIAGQDLPGVSLILGENFLNHHRLYISNATKTLFIQDASSSG
jgi:predicted aspartyl protease